MKTYLEFYFTKIEYTKVRYWRNIIDISEAKTDPDDIVLRILESDFNETPRVIKEQYIIHSTSWRYEKKDSIILTYIVYSDYMEFGDNKTNYMPINELKIAKSASHKKPRPTLITETNVLSHAIRHLAYLIKNGNHDRYMESLEKSTIDTLYNLEAIPAGEL